MIEMQESEKVRWCTCYHRTNEKSRVILKLLHITQFEQFSCIICIDNQSELCIDDFGNTNTNKATTTDKELINRNNG